MYRKLLQVSPIMTAYLAPRAVSRSSDWPRERHRDTPQGEDNLGKVLSDVEPWSLARAVAYLCLPHATPEDDRTQAVQEALNNKKSRPMEGDQGAVLTDVLPKVALALKENRLTPKHEMLGVLWIKLFHESDVPISADAIHEIKAVRLEAREHHPTLYQMRHAETGLEMWIGPTTSVKGYETANGYSFEELLLLKFTEAPFANQWRMVELKPLSRKARRPAPASELATAPSARPRNADDYRQDYGSGLMAALAAACDAEAAKPRAGVLQKGSRDHRPYSADRSLSALVELLRERHRGLQPYSSSTLKAALPQFVACPRGRPPRKDGGA